MSAVCRCCSVECRPQCRALSSCPAVSRKRKRQPTWTPWTGCPTVRGLWRSASREPCRRRPPWSGRERPRTCRLPSRRCSRSPRRTVWRHWASSREIYLRRPPASPRSSLTTPTRCLAAVHHHTITLAATRQCLYDRSVHSTQDSL